MSELFVVIIYSVYIIANSVHIFNEIFDYKVLINILVMTSEKYRQLYFACERRCNILENMVDYHKNNRTMCIVVNHKDTKEISDSEICPVCLDDTTDNWITLECGHFLHQLCLK
jgi:hypothetical protein